VPETDDADQIEVDLEIEGNQNHTLWKATCYALASDNSFDLYERAVYAALAGDVTNVLPVCESWEDYVWAHYNAMVECKLQTVNFN
jgi:nuclear pore complex protein Nup107